MVTGLVENFKVYIEENGIDCSEAKKNEVYILQKVLDAKKNYATIYHISECES